MYGKIIFSGTKFINNVSALRRAINNQTRDLISLKKWANKKQGQYRVEVLIGSLESLVIIMLTDFHFLNPAISIKVLIRTPNHDFMDVNQLDPSHFHSFPNLTFLGANLVSLKTYSEHLPHNLESSVDLSLKTLKVTRASKDCHFDRVLNLIE